MPQQEEVIQKFNEGRLVGIALAAALQSCGDKDLNDILKKTMPSADEITAEKIQSESGDGSAVAREPLPLVLNELLAAFDDGEISEADLEPIVGRLSAAYRVVVEAHLADAKRPRGTWLP